MSGGTSSIAATTPGVPAAAAEKKFFERPELRLDWFLFQRTFPFDTLPSKGRFFAFAEAEGLLSPPTPQATPTPFAGRWRSAGPAPISPQFPKMGVTGGRLAAIAISPSDARVVIAGSATGGIWRSTDRGNTFAPVSDDQADLAVGALAFAPSDASVVYAGMGDVAGGYMGTGVLKSTDAGATWRRASDHTLPAPGTIANIVVDPSNPDRLYVTQYSFRPATGTGEVQRSGIFLSEDGGKTWKKQKTGLPRDLVHHPTLPRTLYLAMAATFSKKAPSGGVYKTTDGGKTWRLIFKRPYLDATDVKLAVSPQEPQTLYVFTGLVTRTSSDVTVHVSRDGGQNWASVNSGGVDTGQFGYNSYIAADPADAGTLYLGTRDLYKSTDGGASWINLTRNWTLVGGKFEFDPDRAGAHTDQHAIAFAPGEPGVIYVGNDGGLWRSPDGGETFESLNATLATTQFNSVTLHPSEAGRSCGGSQDNGALVRAPGLSQWTEFISGDSGRCLIDPEDPGTFYSTYIFGTIYRFRNHGTQFDAQIAAGVTFGEVEGRERIAFYAPFALKPSDGSLYFGTWRLFVSTNQGNDWEDPSGGEDLTHGYSKKFGWDVLSAIGVGPAGSRAIYTGSAQGRVMRSEDGGQSWNEITGTLPRRFITSIIVDAADARKAYLTVSGFASGHVFRTTDAGATWVDISEGLPNIPANALLIDPLDGETLYAGTDVGVFRKRGAEDWHVFNEGLPPVIVTGFSTQSSGAIQIATYGRGAYELVR